MNVIAKQEATGVAVVETLPILPIKNTILFPNLLLPLTVGRPGSIGAVDAASATEDKTLVVVAQRDGSVERPGPADLFSTGTTAIIKKIARNGENIELLVHGQKRVRIQEVLKETPFLLGRYELLESPNDAGTELEALQRAVMEQARTVVSLTQPKALEAVGHMLSQADNPMELAFMLASMIGLDVERGQTLLESSSRTEALRFIHKHMSHEIQVLEVRHKIAQQAASELGEEHRKVLLRQQLRAIQEELGEKGSKESEEEELKQRFKEAELPEDVRKEVDREIGKLERIPGASPDYQVTRGHLELILELPWSKKTVDRIEVKAAKRILDKDHYDLQDVKDRILEHLAVMKLNPKAHAPILCFVGPPGVGKTSLGQSIARSIGRRFERMSLGGMSDEAELRGHRRTYVGAMPGRILQAIRRAGVKNPLLMMDEIDKLGRDFRGDPASALLEILDPEQNATFRDNYLDLPFSLSDVFFITTANSMDTIPRPLLDRMEILRLSGYSAEEKMQIAKRFLIGRRIAESGLKALDLRIPNHTLARIISHYTREAGVRELERMLGRLTRKVARQFAEGRTRGVRPLPKDLTELLGPARYLPEQVRKKRMPGVVAGLAWTESGGEILYVEAILLPGQKEMRLTGSLGEVMRESAKAAQSYVWAHAKDLGIDREHLKKAAAHVHLPAGAVPKDGPSAGVALVTALASLYTGRRVRNDLAMTGEITLAGLVLPVGGIKEKILAAHRGGMKAVMLPKENEKDLQHLPKHVRKELEIIFVDRVEDALERALVAMPQQAARKRAKRS